MPQNQISSKGAVPYQNLIELRNTQVLKGFAEKNVQPASIDLSMGEEAYRLRGSILPRHGERIRDILPAVVRFPHDLSQPLEAGATYLVKVLQDVTLPDSLYGYTNPKSSSGRNDIQVRLLADGVSRFDTIPRGFHGELWLLVSSRHFLLKLSPGDKLCQLRLFDEDTRLTKQELQTIYQDEQLLWTPEGNPISFEELKVSDQNGSLLLSINLENEDVIGYEAKPSGMTPVLTFNKQGHMPEDFFIPIRAPKNGMIMLEQSHFYIFYTYEWARVPSMFAAEMAAMDERSGEFRSHYAGFIDPGWGYGKEGKEKGWPLVLEIRPFDDNLIIRHGQPICKLRYERVRTLPDKVYGETGSNYAKQHGAMLSKHFFIPSLAS